ncbi:MAG: flagellar hook-basal body complex protein FliE [Planctomycetes bacterium]|nr:flagellar hook-basal body complex protein FliE [Planctomycetota bacterium]
MSGIDPNLAAARIADEFQRIAAKPATTSQDPGTSDFGKVFEGLIRETSGAQQVADDSVRKLVAGETDDVHQVMIAMSKADLSFRMMLEVRNKLVDAYQEVMRMQV